jgi:hypothetical protein
VASLFDSGAVHFHYHIAGYMHAIVVTNEVELYAKNNLNVNPVNKTAIKEGVKVVY